MLDIINHFSLYYYDSIIYITNHYNLFFSQQHFKSFSTKTLNMIEITFNLQKHIDYGQAVFVSGNLTNIGLWAPEKSFRLNWSQGHKWSGTLRIQKNDFLNKRILEYKYFIGKWQSPIPNQIQWQKGQINRQIELNMLLNHQKIDDEWNTRKIKIHLVTKKCITPNQSTQYRYSIIGNCPQLGNWKVRKVLKIQQNIDCKTIRKLSEKINKKDLISFLKNQLIFQVHATTLHLPLEQEKFSYYFIRENEKLQIQRHPGRCFILLNPQNYPHRYSVIYSSENIGIYDEQNFDRPTFSKITPEIYLGSYLKNQNDLKHLKNLGIQAIYSIQTEEDHQDHGISTFYLELLCRQYGILFKTIQIQDKNSRDFVNKSTKAVVQIDELIKNGNTTYVYCSAGKYRSPQMVALYLTLKNGINVTDAVKFIKEKHPVARPNQRIIKNAVYHINKFKVNFSDSQASVESITN